MQVVAVNEHGSSASPGYGETLIGANQDRHPSREDIDERDGRVVPYLNVLSAEQAETTTASRVVRCGVPRGAADLGR